MLEFLSSEFDLDAAEPLGNPGRGAVDGAIAVARTAARQDGLPSLLARDDVLRLAATALADLRDFALADACPDAEPHLDAAIDAVCTARDRLAEKIRRAADG